MCRTTQLANRYKYNTINSPLSLIANNIIRHGQDIYQTDFHYILRAPLVYNSPALPLLATSTL